MVNSITLIISITFMYATPLIFAALGGVISEKSGVVNIGIEGMMTIGAFFGAAMAYKLNNPWLGLLCAGIAGGILALFHAIASVKLLANQTISGVAMNFLGSGLALFCCRLMFEGATQSKPVDQKLPKILTLLGIETDTQVLKALNFDITTIIALLLAVLLYWVIYKTTWGLRLRAVGEHPAAADTLGIHVERTRCIAVVLSGVLAGFGGAAQSLSVVSKFSPTVISGHGFIALAAVIFGKWTPHGAAAACLMFGFSQALVVMLGGGTVNVSPYLLSMLPYLLTLVVLIFFVGRSAAPKSSGVPYKKGAR